MTAYTAPLHPIYEDITYSIIVAIISIILCVILVLIKKFQYKKKKIYRTHIVEIATDFVCSICLDSNIDDIVKLECEHLFHKNCIIQWVDIKNDCPICREKV